MSTAQSKSIRTVRALSTLLSGVAGLALASNAMAQDASSPATQDVAEADDNVIVVSGIRASLQSALNQKRDADSLIEVIEAEDIGKLPDQNLAEVLENVTGVQITRTAGVGTGVQIRGTGANRTEINGVGTTGSGSGRGGINFEDVNAAIIAAVEVTKAPTAQTTEGSVGGTINLRTIRPLDLNDTLATIRLQGEYSELSDSIKPRLAASYGDRWNVGGGEIGIVLAGSYSEQEATSFRPRVDRDNLVPANSASPAAGDTAASPDFDFIGIQFLNQELENFLFTTYNVAGSIEWAPSQDLKFFIDGFYNNQERRQESTRVQGSGVSSLIRNNIPSAFETINFGSLGGVNLGSVQAATVGAIEPRPGDDSDNPNLRFSSDTGARVTDTYLFRGGAEFTTGRLNARAEVSRTSSDTTNPNLSTTLNFINPAVAPDPSRNENPTPFRYDLTGGALTFGINFDSPFAPTIAELSDTSGANVVLDAVTAGRNRTQNGETAARIDLSLDLEDIGDFVTSFDWGYRYNRTTTQFDEVRSTFGTSSAASSPSGTLFSELLVAGPSNFGEFDGRELAFRNFVIIDPSRAFNDLDGTLDILQAALDTTNGSISDPSFNPAASYRVNENTHAFYGQVNLDFGMVRGNVGMRYVNTKINSIGNNVANGVVTEVSTPGSYDFWLPRVNLVADLTDTLVLRGSWTEDLNRPDFDFLKTSISFPTGPNNAVDIGNPALAPETVTSFDASLSWYFAPAAVISVGYFHKTRTNLFVRQVEFPFEDANGFRDITAPCEGGGIFNPVPDRNVLSNIPGNGLCVPRQTRVNDSAETTQSGIEVAFQYDLSAFEDSIGFLSGLGVVANYTYQEFGGGSITNQSSGRGTTILESSSGQTGPFVDVQGLLDFSPHAYNVTLFYEKYGLSARARYTWRDAFRTNDTAGGASLNSTLGFPVVTESRGQLNASITYDLTENINIGVEGVNLTKAKITQSCVNSGAQLCFQGLPDRRITFGASVRF